MSYFVSCVCWAVVLEPLARAMNVASPSPDSGGTTGQQTWQQKWNLYCSQVAGRGRRQKFQIADGSRTRSTRVDGLRVPKRTVESRLTRENRVCGEKKQRKERPRQGCSEKKGKVVGPNGSLGFRSGSRIFVSRLPSKAPENSMARARRAEDVRMTLWIDEAIQPCTISNRALVLQREVDLGLGQGRGVILGNQGVRAPPTLVAGSH